MGELHVVQKGTTPRSHSLSAPSNDLRGILIMLRIWVNKEKGLLDKGDRQSDHSEKGDLHSYQGCSSVILSWLIAWNESQSKSDGKFISMQQTMEMSLGRA